MKFVGGFSKIAISGAAIMSGAKSVAKGVGTAAKGALEGGKASMGDTLGSTLRMKGLGHLSDAYKAHGIAGLKTPEGQKAWGAAIGKAAPSLVAAGGYAAGAKKVYDKTLGSPNTYSTKDYY